MRRNSGRVDDKKCKITDPVALGQLDSRRKAKKRTTFVIQLEHKSLDFPRLTLGGSDRQVAHPPQVTRRRFLFYKSQNLQF